MRAAGRLVVESFLDEDFYGRHLVPWRETRAFRHWRRGGRYRLLGALAIPWQILVWAGALLGLTFTGFLGVLIAHLVALVPLGLVVALIAVVMWLV